MDTFPDLGLNVNQDIIPGGTTTHAVVPGLPTEAVVCLGSGKSESNDHLTKSGAYPNCVCIHTHEHRPDSLHNIIAIAIAMMLRFRFAVLFVSLLKLANYAVEASRVLNVGGDLVVTKGETFTLDSSIDVGLIKVEGTLLCPEDEPTLEIITEGIVVAGENAEFRCGTPSAPFRGKLTIKLKGNRDASQVYGSTELGPRAIVAIDSGVINMHGKPGKEGFQYLQETASPGYTQVRVADASGWEPGDSVVVAPTNFSPHEFDERTISNISSDGKLITLNAPLGYLHWGSIQQYQNGKGQSWNLDERAEVFNLNRNIRIMPDSDDLGGHMIVRGSASAAYVDNVEFYRMGQSALIGRYPFHWHLKGNVDGQYIKNSSIHKSFQRCVVVHQTNFATVEGNTCFDHFGHGFSLEDGNEVKNRIVNNLGVFSKKPASHNALLASDIGDGENMQRFPSPATYWISHPDNFVKGNVAVASLGTGFWMSFVSETLPNVNPPASPISSNTWVFDDNIAHSCKVGITHDGAPNGEPTGNPLNPNDRKITSAHYRPSQVPIFRNLAAYKCSEAGIYFRGNRAVYENVIFADNKLSAFFAYDQELVDCLIVGVSQNLPPNNGNYPHYCGVPVYDGPFFLDNVHFAGFTNLPPSVTAFPIDLLFGGFQLYTNQVQRLTFDDLASTKIRLNYKKSNWADSYGASVRDIDGSLTGTAGSLVVPNHPMTDDRRCSTLNGDDSTLICSYMLGYLQIRDDTRKNGLRLDFNITRQDMITGESAIFLSEPNVLNNKFPIILGGEHEYVVSNLAFSDGQRYTLNFYTMDVGMTSPTIEFRDVQESCRIYSDGSALSDGWSLSNNGSGYSLFVTLEAKDAPALNKRLDTFRGMTTYELICSSVSPPPPATAAPISCFSSSNVVEVEGKGFVSIDSLEIGDVVRAGKEKFSRIYSFIHLDRDTEAEFLQIHTNNLKTPLELTPKHMVFVKGTAVCASQVKVGDMLGNNVVSEIRSTKRRGVFAPVTESGDIIVSGVLASTYSAVLSHTPVNQHFGAHAFFAVRRLVCAFSFEVCESESYSEAGFPSWIPVSMIHFLVGTEKSPPAIQVFVTAALMPLITATYILEQLIHYSFFVVWLIFGFFAYKKTANVSK